MDELDELDELEEFDEFDEFVVLEELDESNAVEELEFPFTLDEPFSESPEETLTKLPELESPLSGETHALKAEKLISPANTQASHLNFVVAL